MARVDGRRGSAAGDDLRRRSERGLGRLELSMPRRAGAAGVVAGAAAVALVAANLAIVEPPPSEAATTDGTGAGFELTAAHVGPSTTFFDAEDRAQVRYRFSASRRLDVLIRVVRRRDGETVRRWTEDGLAAGKLHRRRWDGRESNGDVAGDGTYEFRIGAPGHDGAPAGRFAFHDHVFPVAGEHSYGDRFGEPRSGGRVHEGQDLPSPCSTPLLAARGGRVQNEGYSDALYGYYVTIDGLASNRDYFYAHLEAPSPLAEGDRVRTGQQVGAVGNTGNARSEFCQLHLELWPDGYRNGSPQDPLGLLQLWDSFS